MSKSKGNTVDPDSMIKQYGADSLRLFILFAAPPEDQLEWNERGIDGSWKFLNRIWRLVENRYKQVEDSVCEDEFDKTDKDFERDRNTTVKKVTEDFESYKFNTAISSLMILMNKIDKYTCDDGDATKQALLNRAIKSVILLMSPLTPHICEELWQKIGAKEESIVGAAWPTYDENALKQDTVRIVVQVNGKLRGTFDVAATSNEDQIKEMVLADEKIQKFVQGKPVRKFIYVPGKLANVVV